MIVGSESSARVPCCLPGLESCALAQRGGFILHFIPVVVPFRVTHKSQNHISSLFSAPGRDKT